MNTAEELLKPDDALAEGHALTLIEGAAADALVAGAPGRDPDTRATLTMTGDLHATICEAWAIVNRWNKSDPRLFKDDAGSCLLKIHQAQTGPVMVAHDIDTFRALLLGPIRFMKSGKNGEDYDAYPDDKLIRTMLATPPPEVPTLSRIVTAPVLGPDFRLTWKPGYHAVGKVFYRPLPEFYVSAIPEAPTPEDIADAVAALWEPFAEFPFMDDASKANLFAALLTPFVRDVIDGPTPLFLVSKAQRGTGGTLICDAISTIATGQTAPAIPPMKDESELRKTIGAVLAGGQAVVLLDNAENLKGGVLAAALTGRTWGGRLLGQNTVLNAAPRCLWLANGNNPRTSGELTRRIVYIRMIAQVEDPAARGGFRIANLIPWCEEHRPALVAALLTLIRAWIVADRPGGDANMASFDSWARIVGGVLAVAGVNGFLANRETLDEDANDEDAATRELIAEWWQSHGSDPVGVPDLMPLAEGRIDLGQGDEHGKSVSFGRVLSGLVSQIHNGLRVESAAKHQNRRQYRLVDVTAGRQINVGE